MKSLRWIIPGQLACWSHWSEAVRVDLYSTALRLRTGWIIIDPIALDEVEDLLEHGPIAGILLTNGNHERAAQAWVTAHGAPVYAHPDAAQEFTLPTLPLEGSDALEELTIIPLPGAGAGEIALWHDTTFIFGDAVINLSGLEPLPDKYCLNPARLRQAFRENLPTSGVTHLLFAHGAPLKGPDVWARLCQALHAAR